MLNDKNYVIKQHAIKELKCQKEIKHMNNICLMIKITKLWEPKYH